LFFKVKILSLNCPMKSSLRHWLYLVLYGCEVSAFSVGQLTVGWRDGKARERGLVCASVRKGFVDASQLAYNVSAMSSGGFRTTHLSSYTNDHRKHKTSRKQYPAITYSEC